MGSHVRSLQDWSQKIHKRHTLLCIYKFHRRKKDPIFIQYIKYVCNILASAGIIVNSERDSPSIEMCVCVDCKHGTEWFCSAFVNRVKTTNISDSNQAQVQHSQCSTHLHNIKTNTVLKPTQAFFKLQRCTGLLTCFDLHIVDLDPLQLDVTPLTQQGHLKHFRLLYVVHLTGPYHKVVDTVLSFFILYEVYQASIFYALALLLTSTPVVQREDFLP